MSVYGKFIVWVYESLCILVQVLGTVCNLASDNNDPHPLLVVAIPTVVP